MLGGSSGSLDVYSSRPQLSDGSRSSSSTTTPTSTAPPTVASARLPAQSSHVNDPPAYINSQTPSSCSHSLSPDSHSTPPPSMTSHSSYGIPPDHSSNSNPHSHSHSYSHSRSDHVSTDTMTSAPSAYAQTSPDSPRLQPTYRSMQSLPGSEATSPSRIRVQSLSHIQSLASEDLLTHSQRSYLPGHGSQSRKYEISSMPVTDIIEMVAGLLTKITTTNDKHHEDIHRHIPPPDGTSNLSPQATSVLAFHGKNVPSISILSYLTRIHKYCPTTYEVFLSLLVYFDRMTELVNQGQSQGHWETSASSIEASEPSANHQHPQQHAQNSSIVTPPSSTRMAAQDPKSPNSSISPGLYPQGEGENLSHFFAVDSFNIHRLVIAGVTCASKFFSDVFYTNSRYAKVRHYLSPRFCNT